MVRPLLASQRGARARADYKWLYAGKQHAS